jgi:hypothetical protein
LTALVGVTLVPGWLQRNKDQESAKGVADRFRNNLLQNSHQLLLTRSDTTTWLTFADDSLALSLRYPPDWNVFHITDSDVYVLDTKPFYFDYGVKSQIKFKELLCLVRPGQAARNPQYIKDGLISVYDLSQDDCDIVISEVRPTWTQAGTPLEIWASYLEEFSLYKETKFLQLNPEIIVVYPPRTKQENNFFVAEDCGRLLKVQHKTPIEMPTLGAIVYSIKIYCES